MLQDWINTLTRVDTRRYLSNFSSIAKIQKQKTQFQIVTKTFNLQLELHQFEAVYTQTGHGIMQHTTEFSHSLMWYFLFPPNSRWWLEVGKLRFFQRYYRRLYSLYHPKGPKFARNCSVSNGFEIIDTINFHQNSRWNSEN